MKDPGLASYSFVGLDPRSLFFSRGDFENQPIDKSVAQQDDQSERRESGKNLSDSVTEQSDDSSVTQDDPTPSTLLSLGIQSGQLEKEMGENKGKPTTLSPNSREWNLYLEIGAGTLGVMLLRDCFRS
ncbi:hypothetical protein ACH5RR_039275 [Cinchona calisaya]|uniref:Uncharacterized protein n=1 Tax=Cinchona calisaya TaxID=153742 RepID=A0ABD2Y171_9GENT